MPLYRFAGCFQPDLRPMLKDAQEYRSIRCPHQAHYPPMIAKGVARKDTAVLPSFRSG
jgi:hypothetical protein